MTNKESCPKCNGTDIVFSGNWTGEMISDVHAEHFWIGKCNSCGFTFKPSDDKNKPGPLNDRRNHA